MFKPTSSASQVNALAQIIIALTQLWSQLIRSGSSEGGQSCLCMFVCVSIQVPIYIEVVCCRRHRALL